MTQPSFHDLPLRTQKRARTRIALVEALRRQLRERPLADIKISELARSAGISQATFFNYFPTKGDLLTHFIQLWSLRVGVIARDVLAEEGSALASVEALFEATATNTARQPALMLEIIAHHAHHGAQIDLEPVELAERLLFLPDEPDVASLSDEGLAGILPWLLSLAVSQGELPRSADIDQLTLAIIGVFFTVPLLFARTEPELLAPLYRQQLQLVWAAARSQERKEKS